MESNDKLKEQNKILNQLIRGAKAAHETYGEVIKKIDDPQELEQLSKMRADHREAFEYFRSKARDLPNISNEVESDSGAWGAFAKATVKTAKIFGDKAALKALKEGEEHGRKEYKEALDDEDLSSDIKDALRERFLPTQEEHLRTIEQALKAA